MTRDGVADGKARSRSRGAAVAAIVAVVALLVVAAILVIPGEAPGPGSSPPGAPAPPAAHAFDYLLTIVMENHAICDILTTCGGAAPFMTSLAGHAGLAKAYVDCASPSLPNYLCLTGGTSFGCDGYDGNPNSNGCTAAAWAAPNVVDRLESKGLTWKAYMEGMPSPCYGADSGLYAVRHDPFVYYNDIVGDASRCARVVPAGSGDAALLNDLGSPSTASNFMWLTPGLCHDMHDCTVAAGDAYLSGLVPQILNSTVFRTQRAALFVVFDENSGGTGSPDLYAVWAGTPVRASYNSTASFTHLSFLATVEANWGLASLTAGDASASSMLGFFTSGGTATASEALGLVPAGRGSPLLAACDNVKGVLPHP